MFAFVAHFSAQVQITPTDAYSSIIRGSSSYNMIWRTRYYTVCCKIHLRVSTGFRYTSVFIVVCMCMRTHVYVLYVAENSFHQINENQFHDQHNFLLYPFYRNLPGDSVDYSVDTQK